MIDPNLYFQCKKIQFWSNISKYWPKNSKCGRAKPWSDIPWWFLVKYQKFFKQNSKLRIHSKPDINQSKLTVCTEQLLFSVFLLNHALAERLSFLKIDFKNFKTMIQFNSDLRTKMNYLILFLLLAIPNATSQDDSEPTTEKEVQSKVKV